MTRQIVLGVACILLTASVALQILILNRSNVAFPEPGGRAVHMDITRLETVATRLEKVHESLHGALAEATRVFKDPQQGTSNRELVEPKSKEEDGPEHLADLSKSFEREFASLREQLGVLVGLVGSSQLYGGLNWETLESRPLTAPTEEQVRSIRIGTPLYVVIDRLGLPKKMSGTFYDQMRLYWPHPSGGKNEYLVVFGGGLVVKTVVP